MRKLNKKGTHVGIILSFLIFVTFLAFLYSITQPATRMSRDKLDLLDYLKVELENKFSGDLTTVIISFSEQELQTCVKFSSFDEELEGLGAIVKRVDIQEGAEIESKIQSKVEENGDTIISRGEQTSEKLKFYYSKWFGIGAACPNPTTLKEDTDYSIELYRITNEIFGPAIINISQEINASQEYYEELKKELGVSLDDNFGFVFFDENKNIITQAGEEDVSLDVYAEEIPIQYIDNEANINPGFLSIRVW